MKRGIASPARVATLAGLAIWIIHAALLAHAFPLSELFTSRPLLYIDSPFHQYQMGVAQDLWASGRLVGYDPWFAAGHIGGVNYNASAKLPALLAILLPFGAAMTYKLFVLAAGLAAPGFVIMAVRVLEMDALAGVAATLLGTLAWWISALHWYHTAGMVAYVAASFAALPYVALTLRTVTEPPCARRFLWLGLWGALGLPLHPLFPLPVLFVMPMLVLAHWRDVHWRSLLWVLATVPALSLAPNLFWIWPSVHYAGWADGGMSPYQKVVDIGIVFAEATGRIEGAARGAHLYSMLWFCTVWALAVRSARQWRLGVGMAGGALVLIVFAAVGAAWPVFATLQPNRLSSAGYLLLVVPAGLGIAAMAEMVRGRGAGTPLRYMACASLALAAAASLFFGRELANEVSARDTPHYGRPAPEVRAAGETTTWLAEWIGRNTSPDARILFETSLGRTHDGAHIAGYLARTTGREFIGGPYVFMHYAGYWDGYLFGRPIAQFSPSEFNERLKLYNIGWIVAHSAVSEAYLSKIPGLHELTRHGDVIVYGLSSPSGYFLEGSGKVASRSVDRIELSDVEGAAATIKYHYVSGLRTVPAVKLVPVDEPGDPQPFIRIIAPPRQLAIVYP
ncbi:MAG: hypothetical protein JO269_07380 [Burkholderiaceae bacterium]|nr:hypothetical protein [Burkholderiaceae bacterium]